MRDIVIPGALQDAMSREAQAAREKQARIILGEAEMEIAHSFQQAALSYQNNPTALHLRAMNMLYEGLKEKGALMLVPSSAVESMGMGGLMGAAALRQQTLTAMPPKAASNPNDHRSSSTLKGDHDATARARPARSASPPRHRDRRRRAEPDWLVSLHQLTAVGRRRGAQR